MWLRAVSIGIIIGLIFIAVSITAQTGTEDQTVQKLDEILENQQQMLQYLHFIKNKV